jgi:ABC-type branched-subunit amino acid transport system ATPase component
MFLDRLAIRAVLALLAVASVGCGAARHPGLEWARDEYRQARQNPDIVRHASAALDRAGQTLREADRLWTEEKNVTEVEHLAYVAQKRVEIARATAKRRMAADELRQLKFQR